MAALKTYTFIGTTEESPALPVLGHSLPTLSAHAKEKSNLIETWLWSYPYWLVKKTVQYPRFPVLLCFVFHSVVITSVPYLSSLAGILFTRVPETAGSVESPHRWQKTRRLGIWPVCKSWSQRWGFQSGPQYSPSDSGAGTGNTTGKNTALSSEAPEMQMQFY